MRTAETRYTSFFIINVFASNENGTAFYHFIDPRYNRLTQSVREGTSKCSIPFEDQEQGTEYIVYKEHDNKVIAGLSLTPIQKSDLIEKLPELEVLKDNNIWIVENMITEIDYEGDISNDRAYTWFKEVLSYLFDQLYRELSIFAFLRLRINYNVQGCRHRQLKALQTQEAIRGSVRQAAVKVVSAISGLSLYN